MNADRNRKSNRQDAKAARKSRIKQHIPIFKRGGADAMRMGLWRRKAAPPGLPATSATACEFILEAMAVKTNEKELKRIFVRTAEQRYAEILATGRTLP